RRHRLSRLVRAESRIDHHSHRRGMALHRSMQTRRSAHLCPRQLARTMLRQLPGLAPLRGTTHVTLPTEPFEALQRMLDLLSTTPGAIVYRHPDGWRALEPGPIGYVLKLDNDRLPYWAPP